VRLLTGDNQAALSVRKGRMAAAMAGLNQCPLLPIAARKRPFRLPPECDIGIDRSLHRRRHADLERHMSALISTGAKS
jgi:hypothetical protein